MDKELLEQFQMLAGMMETMQKQVSSNGEAIKNTQLMIENQVTRRIDSLLDGYKLTHEKQYELERRMDDLERIVRELQDRTA